jgi:4'-phosphopantetheinyl transferase
VSLLCLLAPEPGLQAGIPASDQWLTPTEAARQQSLGTAARRGTFLAGRWLARQAVRQWLGADRLPALTVAESGACHVADASGVFVSISHSAGHVACAVAAVPVGVDLEPLARPRDHLALAGAVHSVAQREQLAALAPAARAEPFLRAWTIKEAWLKAREQGLDFALMRSLDFDDDPQGDVAVATLGDLVLAVAADPALPLRIDGPKNAVWRRCRTQATTT